VTVATADNYVARVDHERRRHELALSLHMMVIYARAARHSLAAVRLGHSPVQAAIDVIAGHDAIGQRGMAAGATKLMQRAYEAGWRRASIESERGLALTMDEIPLPREIARWAADYARDAARIVSQGLVDALSKAGAGVKGVLAAVRGFWKTSGRVADNPSKAQAAASRLAMAAYNSGSDDGYAAIGVATGMEFVAVLDSHTTHHCRPLDGVRLKMGDPRLARIRCPRHWGCRSMLRPVYGEFVPTAHVPEIPPQDGFPL
jgi:hypothetical protein